MENLTKGARAGNFCLTDGQWAQGSTANNVRQVTGSVSYVIGGRFYSRSGDGAAGINLQLTNPATLVDAVAQPYRPFDPVQPAGTTAIYVIGISTTGGLIALKGDHVANGSGIAPPLPDLPRTHAPAAYVRVVNNSSSGFTFGVTNFNASGVTTTFFNIFSEMAEAPGGAA